MEIIHQNKKGNRTFFYDEEKRYCVYDIPDIVAVLPVLPNNKIVLVEQFRVPANAKTVELVCGGIEKEENPDRAAIREVKEEVGLNVSSLKNIGSFYSCPAYTTEKVYLYIAYCDDKNVGQELEEHEVEFQLNTLTVSFDEAMELCKQKPVRPELELALLKFGQLSK